jgi:hypothetical protein
MPEQAWAHSKPGPNGEPPSFHRLTDHLGEVGRLATEFAQSHWSRWAQMAGLWHDLGIERSAAPLTRGARGLTPQAEYASNACLHSTSKSMRCLAVSSRTSRTAQGAARPSALVNKASI